MKNLYIEKRHENSRGTLWEEEWDSMKEWRG
jgi:hypothetical protein